MTHGSFSFSAEEWKSHDYLYLHEINHYVACMGHEVCLFHETISVQGMRFACSMRQSQYKVKTYSHLTFCMESFFAIQQNDGLMNLDTFTVMQSPSLYHNSTCVKENCKWWLGVLHGRRIYAHCKTGMDSR
jgi:hypothetical protein